MRAIDLHARVVDQITIRPHPSDVREIGCGPGGEAEHQLARNPPAVGEHEGNVVLPEERQHSFADPAAMPELDRDAKVPRNASNEVDECRQLARLEVWPHLNKD